MTVAEKKRYYSPTRYKTAELDTSLNEFTVDELRVELAHREGKVIDGDPRDTPDEEQYSMSIYTTNRLRTLILCGKRDSALRELCSELEPWIGRLLP